MYVYVISAGENRQKIGKGRDPEERRRVLQAGSAERLELIHHQRIENARGAETLAHRKLAHSRLQGEWFDVSPMLAIAAVKTAVQELGGELPPLPTEKTVPRKVVDGEGLEARRKAVRDYHAKRAASGLKKVTLWLSPEARSKLDALKATVGSKDSAADQAIKAWAGPGRTEADIEAMAGPALTAPGDPKIVTDPKPRLKRTTPPPAPSGLQFGARKAEPGSRLKGGGK